MAMIDPNEQKKFDRDPEEGNFPSGVYAMKLVRVQEIGPSPKFPDGNRRLVFEFEHPDGPYKGKKAAAFVGKSLLKNKEGRESNLVKMARSMGVVKPEAGFDPDVLLNRLYTVVTEFTDGRSFVRNALALASGAAPAAGSGASAAPPGPPPRPGRPAPPPAPAARKFWVCRSDSADPELVDESELNTIGTALNQSADELQVALDGTQEWKPAAAFGVTFTIPF